MQYGYILLSTVNFSNIYAIANTYSKLDMNNMFKNCISLNQTHFYDIYVNGNNSFNYLWIILLILLGVGASFLYKKFRKNNDDL